MIAVENLTKYYSDSCAVDNISFRINKGEILGLLGPNGAGKTTTMRILTCYLQPTSGNISVKEFNIRDNPLEIKNLIGYLPEAAPIYPDMLVYDYLSFVAELRGLGHDMQDGRLKELAGMCGITDVMHRPINELSKGYKQRVGLAHAMIGVPEILVLDEPTSGLDPNQIVEIRDIIKRIGKEKTVILSTHILSEAEATCDRIVIISRGRIVADGATEELKSKTGSGYMIEISVMHDSFDDVKSALQVVSGINEITLDRQEEGIIDFHVACSGEQDVRPEVYSAIREHGWTLLEFHREGRDLETIFRELTRDN